MPVPVLWELHQGHRTTDSTHLFEEHALLFLHLYCNPLFQDEEYARKSRYGGIIAPPTFLQDQAVMMIAEKVFTKECRLPQLFNGGSEYEWSQPMKPGDMITTRAKLADLYEKKRKNGTLLFFIIETSLLLMGTGISNSFAFLII